jgi:hypothetical protein
MRVAATASTALALRMRTLGLPFTVLGLAAAKIGLPAHIAAAVGGRYYVARSMADHLPVLVDRIHELLRGDPDASPTPLLSEMEHTLTDGYARALALEGERWRLEKTIGKLAAEAEGAEHARELRRLSLKLNETDDELERLRGLLDELSERTKLLRTGV